MKNAQYQRMAHAIRILTADAVQQANSGHPGMPLGMAEIAVALWHRHLQHNPANPHWFNRDRFILSNGHGSMLLYALLHLTGYDLPIESLMQFRQLHSQTPGHPEVGITPGVETTTGPLGQGLANAVGMALAEALLADEFNKEDIKIVDHYTYVFVGDGCLMEGISHEACSLAGTLKLNKLIVLYDDNGISIDGEVAHWFADDTPNRFAAYGWHVIHAVDGHDIDAVDAAITAAKRADAPALICCKTTIGQGAPTLSNTHSVHGTPLGAAEVAAMREALGWPFEPFFIPPEIYSAWNAKESGAQAENRWQQHLAAYRQKYPAQADEFERRIARQLPTSWAQAANTLIAQAHQKAETIATRQASQQAIESIAVVLPELLGGSADLTGSNLTCWKTAQSLQTQPVLHGNYIHYGVREFGMSAAINGIALHRGYIPFGGTFLTFSDYSRNAIRLAALMQSHSIFVFTHDSIGLGEDGPTHQSIEHLACLRLIPRLDVWRPADTVETMAAWVHAIEHQAPSCLVFSRQTLPFIARDESQLAEIQRGGYILRDWSNGSNDKNKAKDKAKKTQPVVLIATGSEVALAMAAVEPLAQEGIDARVVSMPSTTVFDRQESAWRTHVLPAHSVRVAIEAGVSDYWRKYVGLKGGVVGIDGFGESAPAHVLFEYFGFTVQSVVNTVKAVLSPDQSVTN